MLVLTDFSRMEFWALSCFAAFLISSASGLQCVDENGNDVDWYVLYKLPIIKDSQNMLIRRGIAYMYITSSEASNDWTLSSYSVNETRSMPARTLAPIYSSVSDSILYGIYNDNPPLVSPASGHGHTKGNRQEHNKFDAHIRVEVDLHGHTESSRHEPTKGHARSFKKGNSRRDKNGEGQGGGHVQIKSASYSHAKGESQGNTKGYGHGHTKGDSHGQAKGAGHGNAKGDSHGQTKGGSQSHTKGGSHVQAKGASQSHTKGDSHGQTKGASQSHTKGGSHGQTKGASQSHTKGGSHGQAKGASQGNTKGGSHGHTKGQIKGDSNGHTQGEGYGHTKGVVVADDKSGFWLIHSVPEFPIDPVTPKTNKRNTYTYPLTAARYGQSFLCISLLAGQFETLGEQLMFNKPKMYSANIPSEMTKYENLAKAIGGTYVKTAPWTSKATLASSAGFPFISYAKSGAFGRDLYSDFVAPDLKSDLQVEAWSNGAGELPSDCKSEFHVMDVHELAVKNKDGSLDVSFKNSQDHSKWAVSGEKESVICIGDINRMEAQLKRGGGTVCFRNPSIWKRYMKTIREVTPCPKPDPSRRG